MEGRPSKRTKTTHLTYDISSDMGLDSLSLTSTTRIKPSLPHDVISAIASFIPAMFIPWGCESADYFIFIEYAKTVFAFAQISRLFSEVALNTQALWSRIFVMTSRNDGDDEPVFPWELFIERSRSAPLYIVWDVVRIGQHGIENFALLFNQRRRWKELYVQDDDCFYSAFELSTGSNNMPDLPALEVLAVSEPRASHEDIPFTASGLKHLSTDDPLVFERLASTLVSCTAKIFFRDFEDDEGNEDNEDHQDVMNSVKDFLVQCPCLESLWIPIHNTFSEEVEHRIIELPSVKALRLDSHKNDHPGPLGDFLRSLHMANLETLEIRHVRGGDASLADLFHDQGFASNVRSLTLMTSFAEGECISVPFRVIDERFHSVSSLTVSNWTRTDQIRACHFPALRRLVIEWQPQGDEMSNPMPTVEDVRTTVQDAMEFLRNREYIDGAGRYDPFHLILCGYGSAARDEEVRTIVGQAGGTLVFEAHPSADAFYSFVSQYAYEYKEESLVRSTSTLADAYLMST